MRALLPRIGLTAILAGAVIWALANRETFDAAAIEAQVEALGPWAPAALIGLWAFWALLFLPGAVLGLAGGALFGPLWGTLWNLIGATFGGTLAFLAARYVASDWVAERAGGKLKRLLSGVEGEGWRFVAFTRLVPLFPFNLLNYALGLTRIGLWPYVLTTLVCMVPGTAAFSYLGYAGREAITGGESLIQKGLLALGLLAVVAFLPSLVRRMRAELHKWTEAPELKDQLDRGDDVTVIDVRGPDEFSGELGHIPGARNIDVGALSGRIGELEEFQERPVTLVCKTDKRSAAAAGTLLDAGFGDVSVLRGGMEDWRQKGFPVE